MDGLMSLQEAFLQANIGTGQIGKRINMVFNIVDILIPITAGV